MQDRCKNTDLGTQTTGNRRFSHLLYRPHRRILFRAATRHYPAPPQGGPSLGHRRPTPLVKRHLLRPAQLLPTVSGTRTAAEHRPPQHIYSRPSTAPPALTATYPARNAHQRPTVLLPTPRQHFRVSFLTPLHTAPPITSLDRHPPRRGIGC